jgi:hypothetical protein
LKIEKKKKRTRGKRLGLIRKEVVSAQLYRVKEIEEARQFQAEQEAKKEAIQAEKEKEKVDKAVKEALDQQEGGKSKLRRKLTYNLSATLRFIEKLKRQPLSSKASKRQYLRAERGRL